MKRWLFLFIFFLLFIPNKDSLAQFYAEPDTVCFTLEELQNIQRGILRLEKRDSLNQEIVVELENQIRLYEVRQEQDSLQIDLLRDEILLLERRIAIRDDEIERLQRQNRSLKWKKYLWFAGGVITAVASSVVLANTTGN